MSYAYNRYGYWERYRYTPTIRFHAIMDIYGKSPFESRSPGPPPGYSVFKNVL